MEVRSEALVLSVQDVQYTAGASHSPKNHLLRVTYEP